MFLNSLVYARFLLLFSSNYCLQFTVWSSMMPMTAVYNIGSDILLTKRSLFRIRPSQDSENITDSLRILGLY